MKPERTHGTRQPRRAPRALRNIGPVSTRWLAAVAIHTLDDLKEVGVVTAYNLVRKHGYNATLQLAVGAARRADGCALGRRA